MHSTLERSPTNNLDMRTLGVGEAVCTAPRLGRAGRICSDVPCVSSIGVRSQGIGGHLPTLEDTLSCDTTTVSPLPSSGPPASVLALHY